MKVPKKFIPLVILLLWGMYMLVQILNGHRGGQLLQDSLSLLVCIPVYILLHFILRRSLNSIDQKDSGKSRSE